MKVDRQFERVHALPEDRVFVEIEIFSVGLPVNLGTLGGIAFFAFNVDNIWTDGMRYMSDLLLLGTTVFFIRQAVRRSKERKAGTEKSGH